MVGTKDRHHHRVGVGSVRVPLAELGVKPVSDVFKEKAYCSDPFDATDRGVLESVVQGLLVRPRIYPRR